MIRNEDGMEYRHTHELITAGYFYAFFAKKKR